MFRHAAQDQPQHPAPARTVRTVRVLRSGQELAEASARAAVHARRLDERLAARAARDARTAEYQAVDQPKQQDGGGDGRAPLPARDPHERGAEPEDDVTPARVLEAGPVRATQTSAA
jgi:hypothetical protein